MRTLLAISALALSALALSAMPAIAPASPMADAINQVRNTGCAGKPGTPEQLKEVPELAEAARRIAGGATGDAALAQSNYRAQRSATLRVRGSTAPEVIAQALAGSSCVHLTEPAYREMGAYQQGRETWILLATPFAPPSAESAGAVAERVLQLVNAARKQSRQCGDRPYRAVGTVRLNALLSAAAQAHAADMAAHSHFAHEGRDGSSPADRATRAGYRWRSIGENIASGMTTPEAAVEGWLKSPPHCANLMAPQFTEMGVAFAVDRTSKAGIYWGQLFGTPRE
jgi:uncharacterized protein YkwD